MSNVANLGGQAGPQMLEISLMETSGQTKFYDED